MFAMSIKLFTDDQYYFSKILCTNTDIHVDMCTWNYHYFKTRRTHVISDKRSMNNPRAYPDYFFPSHGRLLITRFPSHWGFLMLWQKPLKHHVFSAVSQKLGGIHLPRFSGGSGWCVRPGIDHAGGEKCHGGQVVWSIDG